MLQHAGREGGGSCGGDLVVGGYVGGRRGWRWVDSVHVGEWGGFGGSVVSFLLLAHMGASGVVGGFEGRASSFRAGRAGAGWVQTSRPTSGADMFLSFRLGQVGLPKAPASGCTHAPHVRALV